MSWDERNMGKDINDEENDSERRFLSGSDNFTELEGKDDITEAAPVLQPIDSRAQAPVHMAAALVEQVLQIPVSFSIHS
jgi:hypothetical protein